MKKKKKKNREKNRKERYPEKLEKPSRGEVKKLGVNRKNKP